MYRDDRLEHRCGFEKRGNRGDMLLDRAMAIHVIEIHGGGLEERTDRPEPLREDLGMGMAGTQGYLLSLSYPSPSGRLSKRAYCASDLTLTVSVGPLRCLAMMSSATPRSDESLS